MMVTKQLATRTILHHRSVCLQCILQRHISKLGKSDSEKVGEELDDKMQELIPNIILGYGHK